MISPMIYRSIEITLATLLNSFYPKTNLKQYNLCRPMGFEILIGLFGPIKHRVDLNRGKQYTRDNFSSQMVPLLDATIELPGGGKLPMNWERGLMGSVANRSGRTLITKQLADLLRQADDEDDEEG